MNSQSDRPKSLEELKALNKPPQMETLSLLSGLLQRQARIEETLTTLMTTEDAQRILSQTASLNNRIQESATAGWEAVREQYYEHRKHGESFEEVRVQLNAYRESLNNPDRDSVLTIDPADALISTAVTVATLSDTGPVRDATTTHYHVDSKALKETRRKKIAMGHKADDHEDEKPTWSQQMY